MMQLPIDTVLLVAGVSFVANLIGSWTALRIHLVYMRRDVKAAKASARSAHRRLDAVGAPPGWQLLREDQGGE